MQLSRTEEKDKRQRGAKLKAAKALLGVSCALLAVAAAVLFGIYGGDALAAEDYTVIAEQARPQSPAAPQEQQTEEEPPQIAGEPSAQEQPKVSTREKLSIDFESLKKTNPDIIGWIYVPGTVIDYPIARGKDNEYYMTHTASGEKSRAGAIFMDSRNAADFSDSNTTVYGHNMSKSETMFHVLEKFEKQEFFYSHREMFIVTPQKVYRLDVFSVFVISADADYRTRSFKNSGAFEKFIAKYSGKTAVKTDAKMTADDRMITLSTCDHQYSSDSRIAVMAKLSRIDLATYDFGD